MADIVLYDSSQDIQGFPPLLIRSMTFGIPVIAPDFPVLKKYVSLFKSFSCLVLCCYSKQELGIFHFSQHLLKSFKLQVVDGVHGVFFTKHNPEALMRTFSLLISNGKLSKFAQTVASSGRLHAKNMLASDCITGYASLLENAVNFPSDAFLPGTISQMQQGAWEWNLFRKGMEIKTDDTPNIDERGSSLKNFSVVYALEDELTKFAHSTNISEDEGGNLEQDIPSQLDWDLVKEIESSEEHERLEMEEVSYSFAVSAVLV